MHVRTHVHTLYSSPLPGKEEGEGRSVEKSKESGHSEIQHLNMFITQLCEIHNSDLFIRGHSAIRESSSCSQSACY